VLVTRHHEVKDWVKQWQNRPIPLLLRAILRTGRGSIVLFVVLVVLQGLLPIAFLIVTGLLVGAVPGITSAGLASGVGRRFLSSLAGLVVLYAIQQVLGPVGKSLEETLGSRLNSVLREEIVATAMAPAGIGHLEDATVADEFALARGVGQQGRLDPRTVWALGQVLSSRIQGIIAVIILGGFQWWLPFPLLFAQGLNYVWLDRQAAILVKQREASTTSLRAIGIDD
jgi:hypothetical protein